MSGMAHEIVLPAQWRALQKLSQDSVAKSLGIAGKNPARTWHRWESGERQPPLTIVLRIEAMSNGLVTTASWVAARNAFQSRDVKPRRRAELAVAA